MTDDLTIDLSDTDSYGGGFDPLPRDWYNVVISDWEQTEVKQDGKFKAGTPGTKWELTVDDGPYENRKLWLTHWHAAKSLPYLKNFLESTGKFEASDLNGKLDMGDARDRALGASLQVRVVVRPARGDYDESNEIKAVKPTGAPTSGSSGGTSSMLP